MPHTVKIPWKMRLGDIGEAEIKKRLSYFSNPTKYDRDVGIDFYCELLEDDSPSSAFYIQAKATCYLDPDWCAHVKKSTVSYWLRRPFPVFLVVYDKTAKDCHWMSIEDQRRDLSGRMSETSSDSISVRMEKTHLLEEGKNAEFIRKVKDDLFSLEMSRGWPQFKGEEYVKQAPPPPRSHREYLLFKESTRSCLYSLLNYYLSQGDLDNAHLLAEFLTEFDKSHYNHFVWLGQINKALGRKEAAKQSFEKALEIAERDRNWPRESMKDIVALIRSSLESCT